MKLKMLVGSLVALGMVTSVAYAASSSSSAGAPNEDAVILNLQNRITALEATINRNQDNAVSQPSALLDTDWYRAITISGEFQPYYVWNNRKSNKTGVNLGDRSDSNNFIQKGQQSSVAMNTAELYLDGKVNNFTNIHAAINYGQSYDQYSTQGNLVQDGAGRVSTTNVNVPATSNLFFSEANIQLKDLTQSSFYSTLGQQFFNFGSYQHDSISTPMTEMLAKTVGVGATGGYVSNSGFNASAYLFQGNLAKRQDYAAASANHANHVNTWGLSAGYNMMTPTMGVSFQLDYLDNMAQSLYLSHAIVDQQIRATNVGLQNTSTYPGNNYYQKVPGIAAHLAVNSGPFGLIIDYVTAMRRFAANDLTTQNVGLATDPDTGAALGVDTGSKGAKPQALFTQLDYDFNAFGHNNTVYLGYQTSKDSQQVYGPDFGGFWMPKIRENVGYRYYVTKTINVNAELQHNKDYSYNGTTSNTDAGSGRTSNAVLLGLDVKF